jgi:hypothetical protein
MGGKKFMTLDNKHPYYQANGVPKTKKSVVVFCDILGFSEEMRRAYIEGRADELLIKLRSALTESYELLRYESSISIGFSRAYATKTFTDNIVIGFPITRDGESEMGNALLHLGSMQLKLVQSGFFIRGGIAIGDLYIDNDIVYGNGLIDAYKAESQLARDPRIILTESAIEYLHMHLSYYAEVEDSPQYRELLRDVDGQIFFNYLDGILIAEYEHGPFYEELLKHKAIVEEKLEEFANNPIIWSKYAWVANYHNYFCDQYKYFDESHKIDSTKLKLHPSRIT